MQPLSELDAMAFKIPIVGRNELRDRGSLSTREQGRGFATTGVGRWGDCCTMCSLSALLLLVHLDTT